MHPLPLISSPFSRLIFLALLILGLTGCAHRQGGRSPSGVVPDWPSPPPLPAETETKIDALAHYASAISAEMNDKPALATEEYLKAALADPGEKDLVLDAARRLVREQKSAEAIKLLTKAADEPNAEGEIYAWLGLAYQQSGATNEAIQANQKAIKLAPSHLAAYQNLAQLFLQSGRTNDSVKILQKASAQTNGAPEFLLGLVDLIGRYNRQQILSDAETKAATLRLLDSAARQDPDNPLIQQRLGDLYLLHGEVARAVPMYEAIYKKFPEVPGVRQKLADLYVRTGENEKARELLEKIQKERPTDPRTYYFLGSLAFEAKEYQKAADAFEMALRLNPGVEPVYYDLAAVQISLHKPEEALELLEKARSRFRLNFTLEYYTGVAKTLQDKYSEAVSHFTSAELLAKTSDPGRLTATFYFQLGSACERAGNIPEAVNALRKSLELRPDFAEALNYLGYMWAERGENLNEARDMIERALKMEPENAAFLDSHAWVLFKLDKPGEALSPMQKAIEKTGEPDQTLYEHLGDILSALGRVEDAREAYKKALAVKADDRIQGKLDNLGKK